MKTHLLSLIALSALAMPTVATAQVSGRVGDRQVVNVIVGDKGAAEDVQIEFINNAPSNPKDAGLPRFAIVGHDRKFYLGIGAQFLGEAVYDWGDAMPSSYNFTPSSIVPRTPGNGGNLRFTGATSNFYLNFVGMPGSKDRVGLFFKAKFSGGDPGSYTLKVSHIYMTYRGLIAGYTNSFFQDGSAMPFTIDNEGPNGSAALTCFTVGWNQRFAPNFSGGIGIDAPTADLTDGLHAKQVNQRIPAVPLYLQANWGKSSHFRASFIARPLQYRDYVADKNKGIFGWGVQASGLASIIDGLTFYYDATYGKGISNYLQDNTGMNLDAIPVGNGEMKPMESLGLTAGLGFEFSPKLSANLVYSHVTNWNPDKGYAGNDQYRYGDYAAANLVYDFNSIVSLGLEYDYGLRKSFGGETLHTNRLQCQLGVTF